MMYQLTFNLNGKLICATQSVYQEREEKNNFFLINLWGEETS